MGKKGCWWMLGERDGDRRGVERKCRQMWGCSHLHPGPRTSHQGPLVQLLRATPGRLKLRSPPWGPVQYGRHLYCLRLGAMWPLAAPPARRACRPRRGTPPRRLRTARRRRARRCASPGPPRPGCKHCRDRCGSDEAGKIGNRDPERNLKPGLFVGALGFRGAEKPSHHLLHTLSVPSMQYKCEYVHT